ncbi:MAG TPA: lytic transglycosylase domain-containing protein [Pyrinomonadaceae bacterium]|nr:lytic transglycosylase domain-containing protein [Pyrinomonadaceae bacterium]
MKKYLLLCILLLSCTFTAAAQGSRYRFDNFDTREGVSVEAPPAPAVRPRSVKRLKLTARSVDAVRTPAASPVSDALPREVSMAVGKSLDGFTTGDRIVDSMIVESGNRHGVDPVLLYAIMHRESSFKKRALSHKGASGLMQLMPATARRFGVTNIWDPRQNIEGGARYMRVLLNMFDGSVPLALAGYNAGEGAVLKYGRRVPPYRETTEYVRRITERYALMRDPQTARRAPVASRTQLAKIRNAEAPAPVYETNVFAVRMPDGKLRLVSQ